MDVTTVVLDTTKIQRDRRCPPAQFASTCFDSGSMVFIRVVFPAPKAPKTTIFSFVSSAIGIKLGWKECLPFRSETEA